MALSCLGRPRRPLLDVRRPTVGQAADAARARARWIPNQRWTGPRGKVEHVFLKENLHALPKSKTSTLTVTAWPRRLTPNREELLENGGPVLPGAGGTPRRCWQSRGPTRDRHAARGSKSTQPPCDVHPGDGRGVASTARMASPATVNAGYCGRSASSLWGLRLSFSPAVASRPESQC